jgi:hypothetical protein
VRVKPSALFRSLFFGSNPPLLIVISIDSPQTELERGRDGRWRLCGMLGSLSIVRTFVRV